MKGYLLYTTCDNDELTLRHAIVILPVSTYTHQPFIHKYCNFHYWWTAVAWYLMYKVKSDKVLKNLAARALCYVKIWMTVEKPMTAEVNE